VPDVLQVARWRVVAVGGDPAVHRRHHLGLGAGGQQVGGSSFSPSGSKYESGVALGGRDAQAKTSAIISAPMVSCRAAYGGGRGNPALPLAHRARARTVREPYGSRRLGMALVGSKCPSR
jgi:hypothetical protein